MKQCGRLNTSTLYSVFMIWVYLLLLPSRSHVGSLPCSSSTHPTSPQHNIHSCKQNFLLTLFSLHYHSTHKLIFLFSPLHSLVGTSNPTQVPPFPQTSSASSIPAPCSPVNMLQHSTTSPTTTNPTSSHLLKHWFIAPQHLPSKSTSHPLANLFSPLLAPTPSTHLNQYLPEGLPSK